MGLCVYSVVNTFINCNSHNYPFFITAKGATYGGSSLLMNHFILGCGNKNIWYPNKRTVKDYLY
jgi:hypothetical protein